MNNMLFYYIRHGDPIYSPDSLTPLGKRQAEAVAKRLAMHGLDEIYASTSQRAIDTAKPTSEILKINITELDWCNENHAWNDLTVKIGEGRDWCFKDTKTRKLFNSKKIKILGDNWYDAKEFENTDFKKGILRIHNETDNFFEKLGYKHIREDGIYLPQKPNNKRIALFAHQGFGLAFLSSILDIPYPQFTLHFDLSHSSLTVIEFAEIDGIVIPKIMTMSNDSHIYKDGLPTKYNNELYI